MRVCKNYQTTVKQMQAKYAKAREEQARAQLEAMKIKAYASKLKKRYISLSPQKKRSPEKRAFTPIKKSTPLLVSLKREGFFLSHWEKSFL